MENKKTLVLGASQNPARYSNLAINRLKNKQHPVVAIGKKAGAVAGITIGTEKIHLENIDTITLYLNPQNQKAKAAMLQLSILNAIVSKRNFILINTLRG